MKKGVEKFFIYQSPQPSGKEIFPIAASVIERNFELYGSIGDQDSASRLLQKIYALLWLEIKEQKKEYMLNKCGWMFRHNDKRTNYSECIYRQQERCLKIGGKYYETVKRG